MSSVGCKGGSEGGSKGGDKGGGEGGVPSLPGSGAVASLCGRFGEGCSSPSSAGCAAATAVCLPAAGCIGALGFERAGCGCSSGVVARPLRRLLLLSELTTLRGLRCRRLACSSRTNSLLWRDRPRALAGDCQGCLGAAGWRPQPLRRPPPDALDGAAAAIVSTRRVFLFSALPGYAHPFN